MVFSSTCGATSSGPIVYLPGCERHDPRLDVEVAAELLPDDVHVAAEDQVGVRRRPPGGLLPGAPVPLQRQGAEHDRLGRALGARPGGLARRVEQVGEHPDAALLDLGRARVLGVVDEVAVQVLGDDPLRLRLHPGGDEGGQVAGRVALEGEVLAHEAHRVDRAHPACPGTSRLGTSCGDEAVAEQCGVGVGRDGSWSCASPWDGRGGRGSGVEVGGRPGRAASARRQAGSIRAAPTRKQTAPSRVPATATRVSSTSSVLGSDVAGQRRGHEQHRAEHVEPGDPPGQRAGLDREEPARDGEDAEGAGDEEQRSTRRGPAARRTGLPRCAVALWTSAASGADVEEQGAGELGGRGEPVAVVRQPAQQPHRGRHVLARPRRRRSCRGSAPARAGRTRPR